MIAQSSAIVSFSANIATVLFGVVILIQFLIAAGILPITMAWGGRQQALTPGLRMAGVVAAVILGVFAYIIRYRAGLYGADGISVLMKMLAWIVTAFMGFNTFANLTSQSKTEKIVFTPITTILTILCFIVSISTQ